MLSDSRSGVAPLITVCVCTYRRPEQLRRLLQLLDQQATGGTFNFSIAVADNDAAQSARTVVSEWRKQSRIPVAYGIEPRQSIALARNLSVAMASGEYVAFVDDDEEPAIDWLHKLYEALTRFGADGVIGPVIPRFEETAPLWALKGGIFSQPSFENGTILDWRAAATNNALVSRDLLSEWNGPFRPEFGAGGEDRDLFRRAISRGRVFVWASEALCYAPIPSARTKVRFQLRRALLRGKLALRGPGGTWRGILKSAVALPCYAVSLPFSLIMGSHVFVTQLIRSFDHLGKLAAACGINFAGEFYVTEATGNSTELSGDKCGREGSHRGLPEVSQRNQL